MVKVKSSEVWKKKYADAAGRVPAAYRDGVAAASGVVEAMVKGQANYEAQMARPEVLKRREAKLREIDDGYWKKQALEKGAARIGPGMAAGKDRYGAAADKSASILQGLSLPDRTPDVDANIANRVGGVVHAMRRGWGKE